MADAKSKQLALDFEGKPTEGDEKPESTEKSEDIQVIIGFGLLDKRKKIAETLTDLTHFEGGQKPLYTDMEGIRENLYIKSTDIKEARKRLTNLLGEKEINITESRSDFSGELQLLIQERKKPVKRKSSKISNRATRDNKYDPGDKYWPEW